MFDIGWPEIVVIMIVAIVVIGPRDLPKAFYTVGKWVRAARRVTSDFQRHVDDMVRETELEDLKKVANQARGLNVKNQIEKAIDPTGDIKSAFDIEETAGGKSGAPASTGKPGSAAPANSIAAPSISSPAPAAETKAEPVAARKPSPRVASRVPKRTTKTSASPKTPASKAPASKAPASKAPASKVPASKAPSSKAAAKASSPEKTS